LVALPYEARSPRARFDSPGSVRQSPRPCSRSPPGGRVRIARWRHPWPPSTRFHAPRRHPGLAGAASPQGRAATARRRSVSRQQHDRVIDLRGGILQAGPDVFGFQIREVREDFRFTGSTGQHVENVLDPDAHAADGRASGALFGIESDAFHELHASQFMPVPFRAQVCLPTDGSSHVRTAAARC